MKKTANTSTLDRTKQINFGLIEAKTLSECLKVDFATLYKSLFPKSSDQLVKEVTKLKSLGILKRMEQMAVFLIANHNANDLKFLKEHTSDTARGWAAFIVGRLPKKTLETRLKAIKDFADDSHFGVREWAWMAVRTHIASELEAAFDILSTWTKDKSPRIRRFASEATRPRGVWCEHIQVLKDTPALGLPVLTPLLADGERYVQDSVGNWLNDAAKSQPQWVQKLCSQWLKDSEEKSTAYIVKRAQRSIK